MNGQPVRERVRATQNRPQRRTMVQKLKKKLTYKSYMGCCSLRTGSLFIGYINSIFTLIILLIYIILLVVYFGNPNYTVVVSEICHLAYIFVVIVVHLVLHITLLHGVYREKRHLILRFLRGFFWELVITFIILVILSICIQEYDKKAFVSYTWSIYSLLVVRSYYLQLGKNARELETSRP